MSAISRTALRGEDSRSRWTSEVESATLARIAVVLLSLAVFLTQFVFRAQDDNRLTSWQWLFADTDLFRIGLLLVAGLFLAYVLGGTPFPGRRPASVLFVVSFVVAAIFWGEPEIIVDASRYFTQAKHVELYGPGYFFREWGGQIAAWTDLPLIPFLYGLIFSLLGEERIYIQVFTTLLFSGTVVLTYLIGKSLWDESVGFHAGALLLGMPYLLTQVPLMLVDVPTMFFLTLAVLTTYKALELGGAGRVALAAAAVALACLTKYSAWLMLSVLAVVFLVHLKNWSRPVLSRASVLAGLSMLLVGAVLLPLFDVVIAQLELLRNYQVPGLGRWKESHVSTFLFQIHPFITVAALLSLYAAFKRRDSRYAIILWLPALVVLLEVKRIRYILPVFPMLALMASHGLRESRDGNLTKYIVLCIVASSVVIAAFGMRPFLRQASAANLMQAGAYLDSLDVSRVEVIALPQYDASLNPAVSVPLLDLYTSKRLVYRPAGLPPPAMDRVLESPLRFTWEYKNPQYYGPGRGGLEAEAVVVIASDDAQFLPPAIEQQLSSHTLSRKFMTSENIFGYKTIVRVYIHNKNVGINRP